MRCLVITGGSAGIGLSTAERFSEEGFIVINLSRRPCPLDAVEHIPCDLSNPGFMAEIEPQLNPFLEKADQLVLVHNAARMNNDHVAETGSDAFRAVLEVNLVAPNSLNHHVLSFVHDDQDAEPREEISSRHVHPIVSNVSLPCLRVALVARDEHLLRDGLLLVVAQVELVVGVVPDVALRILRVGSGLRVES